ncbi:MAG: hypothetical protein AAF570_08215 [Bacteroidota bacterium]
MEYYHAKIRLKGEEDGERIENMSVEKLRVSIVEPYQYGREIFVKGKAFDPYKIERIQITRTTETTDIITERLKRKEARENRNSGVVWIGGPYAFELAMFEGEDVLDQFIEGSAGYLARRQKGHPFPPLESPTTPTASISAAQKDKWIDMIAEARIEKVIKELRALAKQKQDTDFTKAITNQSQRWHRLEKKIKAGTIDGDREQSEANKINEALTDLILNL